MPELPTLPSRSKVLIATGVALLTAAALLFGAILPAEYGIDPLGTGRLLGLLALGQAQPFADLAERGDSFGPARCNLDLVRTELGEFLADL